jgi:hypothetical protein
MTQAASVHSTPRTDSSLFRLVERELDPRGALAELFREELHPDPEWMADHVIEHLRLGLRDHAHRSQEGAARMRAWTIITTERTRRQRERLAEEISRIQNEKLRVNLQRTTSALFIFLEDDLERWDATARAGRMAEAALAEIRQLLADGKFHGNELLGMIIGIAKHGPRQGGG